MSSADSVLFDLINRSWTSPFLDHFMPLISSLDVWKPFMFAGAVWALILGGRSGRLFLLSVVIGLLLGDVILSHALKHAFSRPRPRDIRAGAVVRSLSPGEPKLFHVFEPPVVVVSEPSKDPVRHGNSFPSSHVINFFMFATVAFRFRRWGGVLPRPRWNCRGLVADLLRSALAERHPSVGPDRHLLRFCGAPLCRPDLSIARKAQP